MQKIIPFIQQARRRVLFMCRRSRDMLYPANFFYQQQNREIYIYGLTVFFFVLQDSMIKSPLVRYRAIHRSGTGVIPGQENRSLELVLTHPTTYYMTIE